MRFSLVVATLGRTDELRRLLESLERQTYTDFEVIVVDQNSDARLDPILVNFEKTLELRRLSSSIGASRARNVGAKAATGDIVCFPDDDCWYPADLLQSIVCTVRAHARCDALIGEAVDQSSRPILPWNDRSGEVTKPVCWRRAVCFVCIYRTHVLRSIGGFDEEIGGGAGTIWGGGEDNDLMLRALDNGFRVRYQKELRVYHPRIFHSFDAPSRVKRYSYSLGDGRVLRKHPMPVWWRVLFFAVPLGRAILASIRFRGDEFRYHWATYVGRVRGFRLSVA